MIDDIYDADYDDGLGLDLQEEHEVFLKEQDEIIEQARYDLVKDLADRHYRANGYVRIDTLIELTGFDKVEIIEYLQEEDYEEINDGMFTKINEDL